MTVRTRAQMLDIIAAKFSPTNLSPPSMSDLYSVLTDMLDSQGQSQLQSVTATADGLTTGLVNTNTGFIQVTSANAGHIVTLPDKALLSVSKSFSGYVGANGFKLGTPATSNQKINNVDSDGTQLCAIPANSYFHAIYVDATQEWIVWDETRLGARTAAIVPA